MNHKHGLHTCQCPSCGHEEIVEAYVKCNELYCPQCSDRLRAFETGEYRGISQTAGMTAIKTIGLAILSGVGVAIGLYLMRKIIMRG